MSIETKSKFFSATLLLSGYCMLRFSAGNPEEPSGFSFVFADDFHRKSTAVCYACFSAAYRKRQLAAL
ncbi:MAG: hypothetical protein KH275_01630 [Clostridiales bacterium]|nr:hypothetical protein [Clostridiales bacterium]